jgi:sec-independent protein translocase protein TatA
VTRVASAVLAPLPPAFLGLGFSELLLVAVVALLVFGGDLPDVMRSLGRSYARLRAALHDVSRPVREEIRGLRDLRPLARENVPQEETPAYPADGTEPPPPGGPGPQETGPEKPGPQDPGETPPGTAAGRAAPLDEPPPV